MNLDRSPPKNCQPPLTISSLVLRQEYIKGIVFPEGFFICKVFFFENIS